MQDRKAGTPSLTRRKALAATGACFAMMSHKALARYTEPVPGGTKPTYAKDREADGVVEIAGIHQGKGKGKAKFFRFGSASSPSAPSYMMIYELPPGASEGVHTHFLDNRNAEGSFDEYYFILSGQGEMEIDGKSVAVAAGDHIHTPLEVAHGIENTHATENLRVFLTYIKRGDESYPIRRPARNSAGT